MIHQTMLAQAFLLCALSIQAIHAWQYGRPWRGTCASGKKQSPINIVTEDTRPSRESRIVKVWPHLGRASMTITNDGNNVILKVKNGDKKIELNGIMYKLAFIRLHWGSSNRIGSEHNINWRAYEGEIEFVNWKESQADYETAVYNGGVAVVSVLLQEILWKIDSPDMTQLKVKLADVIKPGTTSNANFKSTFKLDSMVPEKKSFFTYSGSNTVPYCNERVERYVFESPLLVSPEFMKSLRAIKKTGGQPMSGNRRTTQPINGRTVYYRN